MLQSSQLHGPVLPGKPGTRILRTHITERQTPPFLLLPTGRLVRAQETAAKSFTTSRPSRAAVPASHLGPALVHLLQLAQICRTLPYAVIAHAPFPGFLLSSLPGLWVAAFLKRYIPLHSTVVSAQQALLYSGPRPSDRSSGRNSPSFGVFFTSPCRVFRQLYNNGRCSGARGLRGVPQPGIATASACGTFLPSYLVVGGNCE